MPTLSDRVPLCKLLIWFLIPCGDFKTRLRRAESCLPKARHAADISAALLTLPTAAVGHLSRGNSA
jgi:hypothetical protein